MIQSLLQFDRTLTESMRLRQPSGWAWHMATWLAHSGDSWFWAAGLALLWLIAPAAWRPSLFLTDVAVVIQALSIFALKRVFRRSRPAGEWGSFYRQIDPHSFPSGHATRAMLLLTLAWALWPAWIAIVISLWALAMSLARVLTGVHYLSDIVGGWFFGLCYGLLAIVLFFVIW